MPFKFNVNLTDDDYLDYNIFWTTKSYYGKKQMIKLRIIIAALFGVISLFTLFRGGFSPYSFLGVIPCLIAFIIFEAALNSILVGSIKSQIKSLKKKGKMAYSQVAEMEFSEHAFTETTPTNKTEQHYSSIERISIFHERVIYIHVNSIMSYILPISCFDSKEQYEKFLAFIETKCENVDTY